MSTRCRVGWMLGRPKTAVTSGACRARPCPVRASAVESGDVDGLAPGAGDSARPERLRREAYCRGPKLGCERR
jgi:hypothetical protein